MTFSVYIPVVDNTIDKLDKIIDIYNSSVEKPLEIVILAYDIIDDNMLNTLKKISDRNIDNVKVYGSKTLSLLPDVLNKAFDICKGDVIMYHNPKMIPSTKRFSIVKQFFENNDIMCLTHPYHNYDIASLMDSLKYRTIESKEIFTKYFPFNNKLESWLYTRTYGVEFGVRTPDFSSLCVNRTLGIKWKETHEYESYRGSSDGLFYEFLIDTLYTYNKSVIVDVPLTIIG